MCWPFGCVHSKAGEVIEPSNVFHSEKLHWPFKFRANYQGRECAVVACEESWSWFSVMQDIAGEFFCRQFSLWERISKQWLFATYSNYVGVWIRPLECSRKLSVRLCAANLQKVAVQAMEGSSDWQNVTKVQKPVFGRLSKVFQGFGWFSRAQRDGRPTVRIAHQCTETTVNLKLTLVQAQWQSGAN